MTSVTRGCSGFRPSLPQGLGASAPLENPPEGQTLWGTGAPRRTDRMRPAVTRRPTPLARLRSVQGRKVVGAGRNGTRSSASAAGALAAAAAVIAPPAG